jgi:vacuolar iron transporter family protein
VTGESGEIVTSRNRAEPVIRISNAKMKNEVRASDLRLARTLILDELFDLSLYRKLRSISNPDLQKVLSELISVEVRHLAFWQDFFELRVSRLNAARKLKFWLIVWSCKLLGAPAVDLALEAIEVYGIRKYLEVWRRYRNESLGEAVQGILHDEFRHEDVVVSRLKERIINPDRVRNIFLGINDGMVEILGAVSGFFASFGKNSLVLVAGLTTAVAGALSMAAGAYAAMSSEYEVRRNQEEKSAFLGETEEAAGRDRSAIRSGLIVGISYFFGAAFPLVPVVFGAKTPFPSILTGGSMILLVSVTLAFLSGMAVKKRALTNLVLIALAVGISYWIGFWVRRLLGIEF